MPKVTEKIKVETLKDFTDFLQKVTDTGFAHWFRGCGKDTYQLIPSLYRHPDVTDTTDLLTLEVKIITRFKQRSIPYLQFPPQSDWEYLFLMQHVGVPTRLLDWTENPFISLFFALISARRDEKTNKYEHDASVWVLNPSEWNSSVLKDVGYKDGILSIEHKVVSNYKPSEDFMKNFAIAIYGSHNSPRIVAQRGVFTLFGKSNEPMENVFESNDEFPETCLKKLIIPKDKIELLLEALISFGYTDSVVYPDLDGLARELKRFFKYTV